MTRYSAALSIALLAWSRCAGANQARLAVITAAPAFPRDAVGLDTRQADRCEDPDLTLCPDRNGCCTPGAQCSYLSQTIPYCAVSCNPGAEFCTGTLVGLCCNVGLACNYGGNNLCTRPSGAFPPFSFPTISIPDLSIPTPSLPLYSVPNLSIPNLSIPDIPDIPDVPDIPGGTRTNIPGPEATATSTGSDDTLPTSTPASRTRATSATATMPTDGTDGSSESAAATSAESTAGGAARPGVAGGGAAEAVAAVILGFVGALW